MLQEGNLGQVVISICKKKRQAKLATSQKFKANKGYLGQSQIEIPHKKPKLQELTTD